MPVSEHYQIRGRSSKAIVESVEQGIREGELAAEERLPPIRSLATSLDVSPATVAAAYRKLGERGLVRAGPRRGTVVSPRPPIRRPGFVAAPEGVRDLRMGYPDDSLLPDLESVLRSLSARELSARRGIRNDPELVEIAQRGFAADGIDPAQVAVVGGALDGVERVLSTRVNPGDLVAVEDPCYPPILDLVSAVGATALPVAVDDEGVVASTLAVALARQPSAFITVPRAQNPTGAATSRRRAAELRALLQDHKHVLVVVDDYAHGLVDEPFPKLIEPGRGSWSVIRTVSKSLHPDLRLAVAAGDDVTISRLEGRQALGTGWVSRILQRSVAALWSDPATERCVALARTTYRERREALIRALVKRGVEARGRTGLNVWVPVREEAATVEALLASGWAVHAGEGFRMRSAPAIRITISTLQPDEVPGLADAIVAARRAGSAAPRTY
jgi:DNA-binding transcriptional MocR family regulator